MRKIAFIDRDGTIIKEPADEQVDLIEKIELLPEVITALQTLKKHNYELVMVTNQDGLGTNSFPEQDFKKPQEFLLRLLSSQGIEFDDILVCPHFPHDDCSCRKPQLGLVKGYLNQFDPKQSFVAGDRDSDAQLAENLGLPCHRLDQVTWSKVIEKEVYQVPQANLLYETKETSLKGNVLLDGQGHYEIDTGLPFFDHMLEQIAKHSGVSIELLGRGDIHRDDHHMVEDAALALGKALGQALGDKVGRARYGFLLPMDDTLVHAAIDLGGRPYCKYEANFQREQVGGLATEMVPHFFQSLAQSLKANIHIEVKGENTHHQVEASFKAFAKCLYQATQVIGDQVMSTKGQI